MHPQNDKTAKSSDLRVAAVPHETAAIATQLAMKINQFSVATIAYPDYGFRIGSH